MDEMTLLREFRADIPEPSDLARQRARRALLDPPRRAGPPLPRRGVLVAAATAVVGAVAVGAAIENLPDGGTQPARPVTALVTFEQPAFPLTLTAVPACPDRTTPWRVSRSVDHELVAVRDVHTAGWRYLKSCQGG